MPTGRTSYQSLIYTVRGQGVDGVDPISLPLQGLLIVITPSRRYINFFNAQASQRANNVTGQLEMSMSPVLIL